MALWIGWLGMVLIVVGTYVPMELSRWLFLVGTTTLGGAAILGQSRFYLALQGPIILGALTAFFPGSGRAAGVMVMFLSAFSAIIYLARAGELQEWQSKLGAGGLVLLAAGFSTGQKAWLLPANLILLFNAAYRLHYKQEKIAIVWLVLEVLATLGTLFSLIWEKS